MFNLQEKLQALNLQLPEAPAPAANYVPFVRTGNLLFISGQISSDENGLITMQEQEKLIFLWPMVGSVAYGTTHAWRWIFSIFPKKVKLLNLVNAKRGGV